MVAFGAECRLADARRVLLYSKRPEPLAAANIGTWFDILQFISFVSVVTNCLLIAFQTGVINEWSGECNTRRFRLC